MVLDHADQPAADVVGDHVGVAQGGRRRQRLNPSTNGLAVESAVLEIAEVDDASIDQVLATTVLVSARPDVVSGWCHILLAAIGGAAHDELPAAFGRPALEPIQVTTVEPR